MKIESKASRALQTLGIVRYCKFSRTYRRTYDDRIVTASDMQHFYENYVVNPRRQYTHKELSGKRFWRRPRISNKQRNDMMHNHEAKHTNNAVGIEFGSVSSFMERAKARAAAMK